MDFFTFLNPFGALFGAMFVLALVPDISGFSVMARTLSGGLAHGLATIFGIMLGDLLFILLAVFGLSALAHMLENSFVIILGLAAAYLIISGLRLVFYQPPTSLLAKPHKLTYGSDITTGFLITLADPKAIVFYASLLPAFIDLRTAEPSTILFVTALAMSALLLAKTGLALLALFTRSLIVFGGFTSFMHFAGGAVMIAAGAALLLKAAL